MKNFKVFQDSVHGTIEVESLMMQVIDTTEFQRLRHLHQMGSSCFVFPACTHTRFEHCIGTYHLMRRLLKNIHKDNTVDARARLTEGERFSLKLAALCHDLGHGPFSHAWERFVKKGGSDYDHFTHEDISCRILVRIIANDKALATSLDEMGVDLDLVCALIRGRPDPDQLAKLGEKSYIFELLANSWNGMDVDKWDYIIRDCFHIGMGQGSSILELERFLCFYRPAKVEQNGEQSSGWHLCFRDSETENIMRVFSHRMHLHRQVYSHKTATAIEMMLLDICCELDPIFNFRKISLNAATLDDSSDYLSQYLRLDETNLWAIASGSLRWSICPGSEEEIRAFERTKELCRRIQMRHLYTLVGTIYAATSTPDHTDELSHLTARLRTRQNELTTSMSVGDKFSTKQTIAIPVESLGSSDVILKEIAAYLPENSVVSGVKELRLVSHRYDTNSTASDPIFFAYRTLDETFTFKRSLTRVICFMIIWTGYQEDRSPSKSQQVPPCLLEAFRKWRAEKLSSL